MEWSLRMVVIIANLAAQATAIFASGKRCSYLPDSSLISIQDVIRLLNTKKLHNTEPFWQKYAPFAQLEYLRYVLKILL